MKHDKITDPRSPTYAPDDDNIKVAGDPRVDDDVMDPDTRHSGGGENNPAPLEVPSEEKTPAEIPAKS